MIHAIGDTRNHALIVLAELKGDQDLADLKRFTKDTPWQPIIKIAPPAVRVAAMIYSTMPATRHR